MADKSKAKDSKMVSFAKNLKAEWSKILWPTPEDTAKQSAAVVIASVVIGLIIVGLDAIIQYGVDFLIGI